MGKNKKNTLFVGISILFLCITLLIGNNVKAQDAETGYWSLTSGPVTEAGLEEYYGDSHKLSYKEDKENNTITHFRTTSFTSDAYGYVEGNFITTYSLAPSKLEAGQTVSFDISASVDNNMKNYLCGNYANVYLNDSIRFYRKSDDSSYGTNLSITTGPNHVWSGSETVYYKIPAGKKEGDTITITAETSRGQASMGVLVGGMTTKWTYTWVAIKTTTPEPAANDPKTSTDNSGQSIKKTEPTVSIPQKGIVAKIKNVKGAKAKVTVKVIDNVSKYQIRYRVGSAKKWKSMKASAKNTFTLKVKKGKIVYVQARYSNAAGAGKWGKTKKFKTDRK
ncbi:MAG: hypothetical protein IJ232_04400 [Lachnospiraceae bacterium]|nr:hypothetical protein [Lachnospiraceae bacterium]